MPLTDPKLWARIDAHPMPDSSDGTTFVQQLSQDHKIKENTARAAIAEYKRFLYLSSLGQGRCVPTKAVDLVWHLHLTHTRDYWDVLVPNALGGRPVHHSPGIPDGHSKDFDATRMLYEAEFDEEPPKGFWKRRSKGDVRSERYSMVVILPVALGIAWLLEAPSILLWMIGFAFVLPASAVLWEWGTTNEADGDVQIGISVWADGDGGDCGSDDGGGCGD